MNIGIISYFRERGLYYLSSMFHKALEKFGNVYILAKPEGKVIRPIIAHDFQGDVHFLETSNITSEVATWGESNSLDVVFSFETYGHLPMNFNVLAELRRVTGARMVEVPMADCFWRSWVEDRSYQMFDAIICLTAFAHNIFSTHKYNQAYYIRPGFKCSSGGVRKDRTITYFHPGGWGGSNRRKNSVGVLRAFENARRTRADIELLFHSQLSKEEFKQFYGSQNAPFVESMFGDSAVITYFGTLPRKVFLDLYSRADATVCPALREGLGLTIFESMALGRPCITTNAPPMSEVILHGQNGWLCKVESTQHMSNHFTPIYHPSSWDLSRILKALTKEQLLKMEPVVHKTINEQFSWEAFEGNIGSLLEAIT